MVYKPIRQWFEKVRKTALSVLNGVWETAFPPTCVFCGEDGAGEMDLCMGCRRELPLIDIGCYSCGLPLTGTWDLARISHHPSTAAADPLAVAGRQITAPGVICTSAIPGGRTPSGRLDVVSATLTPSSSPCAPPHRQGTGMCRMPQSRMPDSGSLDTLVTKGGEKSGLAGTGPVNGQPVCGHCIHHPNNYDRTCCPYVYKEPVDWLIRQLKFHARMPHIKVLSKLLQRYLVQRGVDCPELIIPVPMHPDRQRQRGFNQALEIARPLARYFNVPLAAALCERHLDTVPQSELPAKRRASNVRNAFRLRGPLTARHVAIVDDVMTTGATANELARLLKRHGAEHVQVWVLARTVVD